MLLFFPRNHKTTALQLSASFCQLPLLLPLLTAVMGHIMQYLACMNSLRVKSEITTIYVVALGLGMKEMLMQYLRSTIKLKRHSGYGVKFVRLGRWEDVVFSVECEFTVFEILCVVLRILL